MAALQALGVPQDSPLRNLEQIPRPVLAPPIQSQVDVVDDEDTLILKELVQAIDAHMKIVDLDVISNFNPLGNEGTQQTPTEDVPDQPVDYASFPFFQPCRLRFQFLIIFFPQCLFSFPFIIRFAQSPRCGGRILNLNLCFSNLDIKFYFPMVAELW